MCNLYNVYIYNDYEEYEREPMIRYTGLGYSEMTDKVEAAVELDLLIVIERANTVTDDENTPEIEVVGDKVATTYIKAIAEEAK